MKNKKIFFITIAIVIISISVLLVSCFENSQTTPSATTDSTSTTSSTISSSTSDSSDKNPSLDNPVEEYSFEEFASMLRESQDFEITINLLSWGGMVYTEKRDGNLLYRNDLLVNIGYYYETIGDKQFKYTQNSENPSRWTKSEASGEERQSLINDEVIEALMNPNNFEKVDGEANTYKQKNDVTIPLCSDVVITIDDGTCTITMNAYFHIDYSDMVVVISNIGQVELTLPSVEE